MLMLSKNWVSVREQFSRSSNRTLFHASPSSPCTHDDLPETMLTKRVKYERSKPLPRYGRWTEPHRENCSSRLSRKGSIKKITRPRKQPGPHLDALDPVRSVKSRLNTTRLLARLRVRDLSKDVSCPLSLACICNLLREQRQTAQAVAQPEQEADADCWRRTSFRKKLELDPERALQERLNQDAILRTDCIVLIRASPEIERAARRVGLACQSIEMPASMSPNQMSQSLIVGQPAAVLKRAEDMGKSAKAATKAQAKSTPRAAGVAEAEKTRTATEEAAKAQKARANADKIEAARARAAVEKAEAEHVRLTAIARNPEAENARLAAIRAQVEKANAATMKVEAENARLYAIHLHEAEKARLAAIEVQAEKARNAARKVEAERARVSKIASEAEAEKAAKKAEAGSARVAAIPTAATTQPVTKASLGEANSLSNWDITGSWEITCDEILEKYGGGPYRSSELSMSVYRDVHKGSNSSSYYADFDFIIIEGIMKLEPHEGSDNKTSGDLRYEYKWRGRDPGDGQIQVGSEANFPGGIIFFNDGTECLGTFHCDYTDKVEFIGEKICDADGRARSSMEEWESMSDEAWDTEHSTRWGGCPVYC